MVARQDTLEVYEAEVEPLIASLRRAPTLRVVVRRDARRGRVSRESLLAAVARSIEAFDILATPHFAQTAGIAMELASAVHVGRALTASLTERPEIVAPQPIQSGAAPVGELACGFRFTRDA